MEQKLLEELSKQNPNSRHSRKRNGKQSRPVKPKLTIEDNKIRYTGWAIEIEVPFSFQLFSLILRTLFE